MPRLIQALLSTTLILGGGAASMAAADPDTCEGSSGFCGGWLRGHVSIGGRVTRFSLADRRRVTDHGYDNANVKGNYLGSLWGLDAVQHYFPNPFVEYGVVSSLGVGLAYDQARARTLDWTNAEQVTTAGDGDVEIRGLQLYAFLRWPKRARLRPRADLGLARYWSRFFPNQWGSAGRHFVVDDTRGSFFALGCDAALGRHLGLDTMYRHSMVSDVKARAYFDATHHRSGAFPMRSDLLGVGVFYAF
jgi:hypothetical protein